MIFHAPIYTKIGSQQVGASSGLVTDSVVSHTGTGIAGTLINVPVSLGGATPKAYRVRAIGRTELVDTAGAGNLVFSYGLGTAAGARCIGVQSQTGVSPSNTDRCARNDSILVALSTAGAVVGRLGINAVSANNIQFIVAVQFPADYAFIVDVWAGSDITNATVFTWTLPSSNGAASITTVGHPVRYLEVISATVANNTAAATAVFQIGKAYIPDLAGQCISYRMNDNVATADTARYCSDNVTGAQNENDGSSSDRFTVTGSLSNGFTISVTGTSGSSRVFYGLALDGTFNCKMGSSFTEDDTPTIVSVDPGFLPALTDIMSHCTTETTVTGDQAQAELTIGSFLGQSGSTQNCIAFHDVDNVNPTLVGTSVDYTEVYTNFDNSAVVEGVGAITTATGATAWRLQMVDPDPTLNFFVWTSFGSSDTPVVGTPSLVSSGQTIKVLGITCQNTGINANTVTLFEADQTTVIDTIRVPAGDSKVINVPFLAHKGLFINPGNSTVVTVKHTNVL